MFSKNEDFKSMVVLDDARSVPRNKGSQGPWPDWVQVLTLQQGVGGMIGQPSPVTQNQLRKTLRKLLFWTVMFTWIVSGVFLYKSQSSTPCSKQERTIRV